MVGVRDLTPRLRKTGWFSAADHAEHEGVSLSIEWLGRMVQLDLGRQTRTFPDQPTGIEPAGQPKSDALAADTAGAGAPTRSNSAPREPVTQTPGE